MVASANPVPGPIEQREVLASISKIASCALILDFLFLNASRAI